MKELIFSTMESPTSSITISSPIPLLKKLKIMFLAHAIGYHEARDWIRLQNQSTLTYQWLLAHCKLLVRRCEQYQKAQLRGRAELTTITGPASVTSSVHQDMVTTHTKKSNCTRCGYNHPKAVAQHLDNNVITVVDLDTIQLYVRNQGFANNTIALADLLQEDPVTDTAAHQQPEATAGHPIEAGHTGVPAEVLTTNSTGHPSNTTGKVLHHIFIRLATLHIFFQDHMQQKDS